MSVPASVVATHPTAPLGGRRAGAWPWFAAAVAALLAGTAALDAAPLGLLSHHMGRHILLMNVVALLVAHGLTGSRRPFSEWLSSGRALAAATVLQLGTVWAVHAPRAMGASMAAPAGAAAVQSALLAVAVVFWLSVLSQRGPDRWRSLLALLLTGKLYCLLAALIVFAPRPLYGLAADAHSGAVSAMPLADQQLAGLLMISACPLTYVLEAIVITATWLKELGLGARPPGEID